MKKLLIALCAAGALLAGQAHAAPITATAGVFASGNIQYDDTNGFDGTMFFSVFGPDVMPPAFDQQAQWSLGLAAESFLVVNDADDQTNIIDEITNSETLVDLGTFAMVDQFNSGFGIADYPDVFTAFTSLLTTSTPTIAEVFGAVEAITTADLFTLASNLVNDPQLLGLLTAAANTVTFELIGFDGVNGEVAIGGGAFPMPLGALDIEFGGSAFLQATYEEVNAPALAGLLTLVIGGLLLRRRA
ncbi:hypothetical protein ACFO4O_03090 [Glaciecola siphonariae]|uniref:Choice-of-anchor E domain-containing protein n=1 Tax=Glaciecola siphonariae TaxID=521012 RepID=A0ABV9LSM6_9ALTE